MQFIILVLVFNQKTMMFYNFQLSCLPHRIPPQLIDFAYFAEKKNFQITNNEESFLTSPFNKNAMR